MFSKPSSPTPRAEKVWVRSADMRSPFRIVMGSMLCALLTSLTTLLRAVSITSTSCSGTCLNLDKSCGTAQTWIASYNQAGGPIAHYLYSRARKQARLLFVDRPGLKDYKLADMEGFVITARDGEDIPCYLSLPPSQVLSLLLLTLLRWIALTSWIMTSSQAEIRHPLKIMLVADVSLDILPVIGYTSPATSPCPPHWC